MKKILFSIALSAALLNGAEISEIIPSKGEKDLTCGLEPYKFPEFMTQIEFKNGKKVNFVSTKNMMIFYYKNTKWDDFGAKGAEDIKMLKVVDYKTHRTIDAQKAFYVYGSRLMGPKGDDLIPFEYEADAKEFMKEQNGKRLMTFKDFRLQLFDYLNMK